MAFSSVCHPSTFCTISWIISIGPTSASLILYYANLINPLKGFFNFDLLCFSKFLAYMHAHVHTHFFFLCCNYLFIHVVTFAIRWFSISFIVIFQLLPDDCTTCVVCALFPLFWALGMGPRASPRLGRHSATEWYYLLGGLFFWKLPVVTVSSYFTCLKISWLDARHCM